MGIPTVTADHDAIADLQAWIDEHPDGEIHVDVEEETVTYGDTTIEATVDDAQRRALTEGVWDTTALMKSNADAVAQKAAELPYVDV